jgi:hypothetical protein
MRHIDAASSQAIFDTDRVHFIRVDGDKMMVKSPGVIVPMTGVPGPPLRAGQQHLIAGATPPNRLSADEELFLRSAEDD